MKLIQLIIHFKRVPVGREMTKKQIKLKRTDGNNSAYACRNTKALAYIVIVWHMGDRMEAEQGWAFDCTVSQLLLSNDSLLTLHFAPISK